MSLVIEDQFTKLDLCFSAIRQDIEGRLGEHYRLHGRETQEMRDLLRWFKGIEKCQSLLDNSRREFIKPGQPVLDIG